MKTPKTPEEAVNQSIEQQLKEKDRNPSLSYTIKSLSGNIKKLKQLKAVTDKELQTLIEIHKTLLNKYIGGEINFE